MTASVDRPPNRSPEALPNVPDLPNDGQKMPPATLAGKEKEAEPVTSEALEKSLKQLNGFARRFHRSLQFSVDKASNRTVITVINTETKEVVRQIPSEEVLSLARNLESEKSAILSVLA